MIAERKPNTYFNQERIVFVSYYLVYTATSKYMNIRSIQSIAINKSNNHGENHFMIYISIDGQSYIFTRMS